MDYGRDSKRSGQAPLSGINRAPGNASLRFPVRILNPAEGANHTFMGSSGPESIQEAHRDSDLRSAPQRSTLASHP